MAQVTQSDTGRNTIRDSSSARIRSRCWCFTLNNYMESEIKNITEGEYEYIFQEETGKNGTPHLQGLICFKNAMALSALKKLNGRAHWEVCKNKIASINYCQKGDTRSGKIFTNMKKFVNMTHDTVVSEPKKKCDPLLLVKYDMLINDPTDDEDVDRLLEDFFSHGCNKDMFCKREY